MGGAKRPGSIILVSIDTLRADRLGCYGYQRPVSPNLDRLASEGTAFSRVFSPCPYTVPTHASLLAGLYPINHNIGFKLREGKIDIDSTVFLQEVLRGEGYATGAFVSAFVLGKAWGLNCGFDVYDDNMTGTEANRTDQLLRDGMETSRAALDWIREHKDEDVFVWLHYFDVHGPYTPPPGLANPFGPDDYGDSPVFLDKVRDGEPGGIPEYQFLDVVRDASGEITGCQRDLRHYLAGYDNGIMYADSVVGGLVEGLKREGRYDDSLILVTSDHGEALGEGGVYFFHGLTVTPEQTMVPLIIKPPLGAENPPDKGGPLSTVDVMPTVLDFAGVSCDGLGLDGVSLFEQRPDRFVLSENEWQRAVAWRGYCLLKEKDALYDGFCYYFDSQELCRGTRLVDCGTGGELEMDPDGPAGELIRYSDLLGTLVDPKERRIKDKDRVIYEKDRVIAGNAVTIAGKDMVIANKDKVIAHKDQVIAHKDSRLKAVDEDLSVCRVRLARLEREMDSMLNSKSWRLTYPLRWFSKRLKGARG